MKNNRQSMILDIIAKEHIETQEQLLEQLRQRGVASTQATISRDLKQLHLVKEPTGHGTYKYAVSSSRARLNIADKLRTIFHESITSVDCAQNIVVFKTLAGLAGGSIDLCIGTHALLTADVQYARLGLVITDEQHRFGVDQRAALSKKADSPHMLVLSATPIPRTLALIIYGDLDVSVIDELPPGRQKVDTFAVGEKYRQRLNAFIRKQVSEGHQVFIVCPLVGEDDHLPDERKAVTAYAQKLQDEVFPDLRVAVLHGRMKAKEKESVMAAFAAGDSDILVSTTVVEVGVDVPNANLMVVENAERFGLSQLHQLRGRVGRGNAKSWCVLLSDSDNEDTRRRLKVLTQTNDGFQISEEDLRLRGPGDFFGQRQHGLPTLKAADLSCDMRLLEEAQSAANDLLDGDPSLSDPAHTLLRRRIDRLFAVNEGGLN